MINPFKEINWKPDINERRKFALSLLIGFPVIAVVFLILGWIKSGLWNTNLNLSLYIGGIGFCAGLLFYILPQISKPFYIFWYFIGSCIGIVVSNLVLILFFFLILTPFGIIRRVLSKDSFPKSFDRTKKTYWQDAAQVDDVKRYYKQF